LSRVFRALTLCALAIACCAAQSAEQAEQAFAKLQPELDRAQVQWEKSPEARAAQVDWTITRGLVVQRRLTGGNRFNGKRVVDVDLEHEENVRFGVHDKFSISAWILPITPTGAIVARGKDVSQAEGYGLYLDAGKVQVNLVRSWPADAVSAETVGAIELNQWHNVTTTYDGSGAAAGIRIYVDGQAQKLRVTLDRLHGSFETIEPLWIGGGNGPESHFRGQIRGVRIYRAVLTSDEVAVIATETPVNTIAQIPAEKRTHGESEKIRRYFLERAAPADIREAWQRMVEASSR
jgi:Concanavalin A-like lectin/glucanases superfamily